MDKRKLIAIVLFFVAGMSSCTTSHPTVRPVVRDADVYPNVQTEAGLSVAVDAISNPDRVRQYFGVDLTKEDILPVNIVFTNHGEDRFLIKPSDVLLLEGNNVVDPMPLEIAGKAVKGGSNWMAELALQETVVPPRSNYQGILLFKTKKREPGLYGKAEKFFLERLSMRVVVTDQDSGERIHFGPYSLSGF